MIKTSTKMLFMMMTISSTMMVISSSNWLNMWIGLEINLMSFIPLMFMYKNNFLSQSSMMYFLTQSMASIIMIINILMYKYWFMNMENPYNMKLIIMITMMMKMGMPPFHMWFPEIMSKISWKMCMLMMTWQKIAPLYILSMSMINNKLTIVIIIMSTLSGAILGLNHTSTQKIMAYSSINHSGWMMSCALMYNKMWIMYLIVYSMMTIPMCMNMHKYNIMYINQFNIKSLSMTEKMSFFIMMMSMGGMPPFLGFMPKWMTIEYMITSKEMLMLMIMVLSSLVTLSYYMRMISSITLMMSYSQKWMNLNKTSKMSSTTMLYINMTMPMLILMMNFM